MIKRHPGLCDNMEWVCVRFMQHLRKDFRGHKAEISTNMLMKVLKRFSVAYGVNENVLLDAIVRRNWLEPQASNTYWINYDKAMK